MHGLLLIGLCGVVTPLSASRDDSGYVFTLAPAALPVHQALNLVNNSAPQPFGRSATWGGGVVQDHRTPTVHHMYAGIVLCCDSRSHCVVVKCGGAVAATVCAVVGAASMEGPCGLSAWETNSVVLHARSETGPGGPFVVQSVAVQAYAHNPEIVYSPADNRYLLFTLGERNSSVPVPCTNHTPTVARADRGRWISSVRLHTSVTPEGPWIPLLDSSTGQPVLLADGLNANPTVWVHPTTGEITLLYGMFSPRPAHVRRYMIVRAPSCAC